MQFNSKSISRLTKITLKSSHHANYLHKIYNIKNIEAILHTQYFFHKHMAINITCLLQLNKLYEQPKSIVYILKIHNNVHISESFKLSKLIITCTNPMLLILMQAIYYIYSKDFSCR